MSNAASSRPTVSDDSDEIDLRELLGTLLDHKWLITVVTTLFFVVALIYAILATPVYQANALVQVEQKIPTLPGLTDLSQLVGDSAPEAVTEIALMTSRMVVGEAVDAKNLNIVVAPKHLPLIGGFIARHYHPDGARSVASPWLGMSGYDWGGSDLKIQKMDVSPTLYDQPLTLNVLGGQRYRLLNDDEILLQGRVGQLASANGVKVIVNKINANPGTNFEITVQSRLETISNVQKILSASEQGKDSGIISVSYQDADPVKADDVLDSIINYYVKQNVDRASEDAAQSLRFVQSQLPEIRQKLNADEGKLADYQTKVKTADMSLQTKSLLDQIVGVETQLSQLKLQQAEIARKFTPQHPAYQALMQQIQDVTAKRDALEKKVGGLPDTQQQLLKLTRDVKVGTETYTNLLGQEQQLSIAKAGTVGNARIVDSAAVNTSQPVSPKRALIVIVGTLLGLFLAVAYIFIRQMLNRGVEDPAAIEALGLPVYASVPLSLHQRDIEFAAFSPGRRHRHRGAVRDESPEAAAVREHLPLLALEDPADLAIEAMRSLRTSLHFAMLEARNNILMITGASPDAGKTFVATNLAVVVAQAGQRVLLIDTDMRKGTLHRSMGSDASPGLSDLLVEQASRDEAVHHTPLEGLDFIGRGHAPPNPSELLMHANFTALLDWASSNYDLVIVDTPPILAVTDPAIIGNQAGTSLLVARFGMNQAREIALAKHRFEQNRVSLKGAIFNAVQKRAAGYYSYGYYEYGTE